MAQLKITQVKSNIRCLERHKRTLAALGLRHPHDTVVHEGTPQILGMIKTVDYLVRVEAGGQEAKAPSARSKRTPRVTKGGRS
jgi:large subunit ribosomal protein L30